MQRYSMISLTSVLFILLGVFAVEVSTASTQAAGKAQTFNRIPFRKVSSSKPPIASGRIDEPQDPTSRSRRTDIFPVNSSGSLKPRVVAGGFQPGPSSPARNPGSAGGVLGRGQNRSQFGESTQLGDSTLRQEGGQTPSSSMSRRSPNDPVNIAFASIKLIDDIDLPALETGAIKSLSVKEGQFIPAQTVVGMIDETMIRLELDQQMQRLENAKKAATDATSIQAATKEYALAYDEYRKTERLYKKSSRSESELKQAMFQAEIAQLKKIKAQNERIAAQGEAIVEEARLKIVEKRLARHVLRSDYDAYVIEIFKKPQEYVNPGEPVLRLGRMDELWAQGNVKASDLDLHEALNRPVTVTLQMANGRSETFEGKVDQIPLENQSSEQYAVKVRITNKRAENGTWLLRPLARVSMVIHMDRGVIETPAARTTRTNQSMPNNTFSPLPGGNK